MKKVLAIVFLIVVIYGIWRLFFMDQGVVESVKEAPVQVQSHSPSFNAGVDALLNSYFDMKASFVDADSLQIKDKGKTFLASVDNIKMGEISHDTSAIYQSATMLLNDIKASGLALLGEIGLTEMRQDFRMISENLYPFLRTINYEGRPLYWQTCPMAFGEDKEASWISNTVEIVNPYLGKNHPVYKSAMLHCGEIKDTIK